MKSTDQSVAHTVTLISLVSLGSVDQPTIKNYIINLPVQSKHIVIFDTLIQQSKPEEVEAVLGEFTFLNKLAHPTNFFFQPMN
jgi:hypothetical protein